MCEFTLYPSLIPSVGKDIIMQIYEKDQFNKLIVKIYVFTCVNDYSGVVAWVKLKEIYAMPFGFRAHKNLRYL